MLSWVELIREFFESHCKVPKAPSIQGLEQTQQLNEQSKYRFYMRNGIVVKKNVMFGFATNQQHQFHFCLQFNVFFTRKLAQ